MLGIGGWAGFGYKWCWMMFSVEDAQKCKGRRRKGGGRDDEMVLLRRRMASAVLWASRRGYQT